jgi:hypothetical protein
MGQPKKKIVYKDAGDGRFVRKSYAKAHQKTTFGERVKIGKRGQGR